MGVTDPQQEGYLMAARRELRVFITESDQVTVASLNLLVSCEDHGNHSVTKTIAGPPEVDQDDLLRGSQQLLNWVSRVGFGKPSGWTELPHTDCPESELP